jgi:hypothetical protein
MATQITRGRPTKPRGRKPLRFLLLDLPSDHEIDSGLATECTTIAALLHNRGLGSRLKHLRISTKASFSSLPYYAYDPKFIHLSCHASSTGVGVLGGEISWKEFAKELKAILMPLQGEERRILTLSCCHSKSAATNLASHLSGYLTGIYYFNVKEVPFSDSLTVWCMYYLNKELDNPHGAIKDKINTFFDTKILLFKDLSPNPPVNTNAAP